MAYTTIKKPSDYFNTKLYTGTGSALSITGTGFQPDWVWLKSRTEAKSHVLADVVRGSDKNLGSDSTSAEDTDATRITSFDSDGFSLGTSTRINVSGQNYASWNWLAGGTASSNTDGNITTTVSANTTSGFSIGTCTGLATNNDTLGHGLGAVPKMIMVKLTGATSNWFVYHASLGNTKRLYLNATDASTTSTIWNNTTPTSSVFTIKGGDIATEVPLVFYAFAEKKGFSKFGSYTGNGSTDGTFVYTGFKPAFIIVKKSNAVEDWEMYDNKRIGYNVSNYNLRPHTNVVESTVDRLDILSNGFKLRTTGGSANASGDTYIYMAFAAEPLVGDNPATAR